MDFAFRPDVLTSGTRYQGEPADFGELFTATAERQRLVDSDGARERELERAYDARNDALEKAGIPRLYNPFRMTPDAEQMDRIYKFALRENLIKPGFPTTQLGSLRGPISVYMAREYDNELHELAAKHPHLASVIQADRSPLLEVAEAARKAEERSGVAQASRNEAYSWINPYRVLEGTGAVLGGALWGTRESPVDIAANLVAGTAGRAAHSLLRNLMKNALANAGVQAVLEPGIQAQRKAFGLEHGVGMALEDIALSGAVGGALDVAVRAPVRAYRSRVAPDAGPYGGVFRDAPSPAAPLPVTPEAPPASVRPAIEIPPDLEARLNAGDASVMPDIDRIINAVPELADDPVVRGAAAEVARDLVMPARIDGVEDGATLSALAQTVRSLVDSQEPRPRLPDETPETSRFDLDAVTRLLTERDADIARLMERVRPELDRVAPGMTERVNALVEAGLSDLLPVVERALKAEDADRAAATFVRDVLSVAQTIPPERMAALADLASGGGNPATLARHLRSFPDLADRGLPQTEAIRMARSLARLSDDAFARVEQGSAEPRIAQVVADHVDDLNRHGSLLDDLARAGITDPDEARRALPDLMGPPRDPDAAPLNGAGLIDDPNGKEAQAQTERLNQHYAAEIAEDAAKLEARKVQAEQARQVAEAEAVIQQRVAEIKQTARDMGMVPADVPVKVFTGLDDLDPATRVQVERANLDAFADALSVFQRASTDAERLAARQTMDLAKANRAVEGFHQDGVVWIAATALDPEGRIAHEVVHALVEAGRLTRAEVRLLAERARALGILTPEREALYRATYARRGVTKARLDEMIDEEAAAHFVEAYKKLPPSEPDAKPDPETVKAQGIVARLMDLFRRLRERLLGTVPEAATAPDPVRVLLDQLIAGEISQRQRVHQVMVAEDLKTVGVRGPMAAFRDRVEPALPRSKSEIRQAFFDEARSIRDDLFPGSAGHDRTGAEDRGRGLGDVRSGRQDVGADAAGRGNRGTAEGVEDPSVGGGIGAGADRLPISDKLRRLWYEYRAEQLAPQSIAKRKLAQGWTRNAFHGTGQVFEVPDPFRPGADFGFHVSLDKPAAANERLGHPDTLYGKIDAFISKLLGKTSPLNSPSLRRAKTSILPLVIKAEKPLRLPDIGEWDSVDSWSARIYAEDTLDSVPTWLAQWIRTYGTTPGAGGKAHEFGRALAAELERRGYDSIIYRNDFEAKGKDSMLLWDMRRVRSAYDAFDDRAVNDVGLRPSDKYIIDDIRGLANRALRDSSERSSGPMFAMADRDTGRSMRADMDALGYRSKALEAAKSLKQAKGTPEQMLAQLKSAGVKDAEIEATGLREFLEERGKPREPNTPSLDAQREGLQSRLDEQATPTSGGVSTPSDAWSRLYGPGGKFEIKDRAPDATPGDTYGNRDRLIWELKKQGIKTHGKSNSAKSGSAYVSVDLPDGKTIKVRFADHELPRTSTGDTADIDLGTEWKPTYDAIMKRVQPAAAKQPAPTITRDEIVTHLTENRVGLREVEYGFKNDGWVVDPYQWGHPQGEPRRFTDQAEAEAYARSIGLTTEHATPVASKGKWQNYSLDPSNPSYRETVIHLPEGALNRETPEWKAFAQEMRAKYGDEWWTQLDDAESERRFAAAKGNEETPDFRQHHFENEPNVVGHMMTSMVKHEGKPTYLIDQIQSDWGQKLRDGGVRDEAKIAATEKRFREAYAKVGKLEQGRLPTLTSNIEDAELLSKQKFGNEATWAALSDEQRHEVAKLSAANAEANRALNRKIDEAIDESDRLEAEWKTARAASPGHPLVNTTDQWTITTLRRALTQAVHAFDGNVPDKNGVIGYMAVPDGRTVEGYNPQGSSEGNAVFYEKIVPKNLRNILRKIDPKLPDPIHVDKVETPSGMKGSGFTLFPLTPEVKRSVVNEGQMMFAFADRESNPDVAHFNTLQDVARAAVDARNTARALIQSADQRLPRQIAKGTDVYEARAIIERVAKGIVPTPARFEARRLLTDIKAADAIAKSLQDAYEAKLMPDISGVPDAKKVADAEAMGLDTSAIFYHASRAPLFDAFRRGRADDFNEMAGIYMSEDINTSIDQAMIRTAEPNSHVRALYIRRQKPFAVAPNGGPLHAEDAKALKDAGVTKPLPEYRDGGSGVLERLGYDHAVQYDARGKPLWTIVFDPRNIRSVHAVFDSRRADSPNLMFAFAGERARTADLDALAKAKEMEAAKADRRDIWSQTGWFKGTDGKWRFEIDDSGVQLVDDVTTGALSRHGIVEGINKGNDVFRILGSGLNNTGKDGGRGYGTSLYHTLINDALGRGRTVESDSSVSPFAERVYRGLADRGYQVEQHPQATRRWSGSLRTPGSDRDPEAAPPVFTVRSHENPNDVDAVLARSMAARMSLTPAERRARPPWEDYDVPESQQIVRFANGENLSQLSYSEDPPVPGAPTLRGQMMFAIRAYHGSPVDRIDEFVTPTFFSQHYGIADEYRIEGGGGDNRNGLARAQDDMGGYVWAVHTADKHGGDRQKAIAALKAELAEIAKRGKPAGIMERLFGSSDTVKRDRDNAAYDARNRQEALDYLESGQTLGRVYEVELPDPEFDYKSDVDQEAAIAESISLGRKVISFYGGSEVVALDKSVIKITAIDGQPVSPAEKADLTQAMTPQQPGDGTIMAAMAGRDLDMMAAMAGAPQREDQIATLARAFQQATQAAQAAAPGVSIERTPDGIVARITRGPQTYDVTRDTDGRVLNLEVSNDLAAQAQAAYANLLQAVTARIPPEQLQAYGVLATQAAGGDLTTLSQRAGDALAQGQPLAENLAAVRRSVEATLGPEQTAQLIDAALSPLPEPARSSLRTLIDAVTLPEPERPPQAANDNPDLGPVSPVEREIYDLQRIGTILEMIGVCRG